MRTVRFVFTDAPDDPPTQSVAESILQGLAAKDALDVDIEPISEAGKIVGLSLTGEHELVSMASERVRKALKARGMSYREEDASDPGDDAKSLLDTLAAQPARSYEEPMAGEGDDEEEYEEYDLDDLSKAMYGQYPLTHPHLRERPRRKMEQDAVLRAARENLVPDQELGLSRRKPMSAEEKRRLAFVRGVKSGMAFYRLGLFTDAERNLLEAVKVDRSDPEAHFYLGLVFDQLGKSEQAERHFRRAIALDPDVGANHFYLANVYQKQGRFDKAVTEYKRSIERDPDVPIVYNNLAWVFFQQGDHERALRAFEQSTAMDIDLPFPHNGLACVFQELGAFQEAIAEFKKAIELYPTYAAAHLKLGWSLLQVGDLDQAIEAFKNVLNSSDDLEYTLSANYSLGHSFLAQGRLLEAQEAFHKVVAEEDDEFVDALLHLGIIQLRLGFSRQAVVMRRRYLRKADDASDEAWPYLAQAYFQAEQYGAAMRACQRALQHQPEDEEMFELMGQIAGAQGKWTAAERHLRRALELDRDSSTAWHHLGWVHDNRGDRAQAVQAYRNAIQRDPDSADSYTSLGRLFAEEGKREEALVLFEKALELAPEDTSALNSLGWLYSQMGDFEQALATYQKALQIEPEGAMLRCNVGALYLQMGRRDDAERELRRVLQLGGDEAVASAHFFLGMIARARQNPKKVIEHMEQAVQHEADLGAAWFRLGETLLEEGDLVAARRALERYLDLDPQGEFSGTARQYVLERLAGVTAPKPSPLAAVASRQPQQRPTRKRRTVSRRGQVRKAR